MKKTILYIFFIKIFIVFGLSDEEEKFKSFINSQSISKKLAMDCGTPNLNCIDGSIIEIKFSMKTGFNDVVDFSEFPILPNLKIITINNGNLKEFPSRLFELPNLRSLDLKNMNIKRIPSNGQITAPLEEMNLSDNQIKGSLDLSNFPNLQKLTIENNQLDDEIVISRSLKMLKAKNNKITSISKGSNSSFFSLETLDLSNNNLNSIPSDFFNNMNLNNLNLSSSGIKELPSSIYSLRLLKSLDISNNPHLNAEIVNFSNNPQISCNFQGTNISCYQENTCNNIDSSEYKPCSEDVINKYIKNNESTAVSVDNNNNNNTNNTNDANNNVSLNGVNNTPSDTSNNENKNGGSKALPIIVVLAVIILGVVGFGWMYKTNQQRKKSREADIIVSPTIKTSNYYEELINSNMNHPDNSPNNSTEPVSPTNRILPESLSSPSITNSNSPSITGRSQGSYNNLSDPNVSLMSSTSMSMGSYMVQSPILQSSTNSPTVNPMMRSPTVPTGHSTRPMLRSTSVPSGNSATTSNSNTIPVTRNRTVAVESSPALHNTTRRSPSVPANSTVTVSSSVTSPMTGPMTSPMTQPMVSPMISPIVGNNSAVMTSPPLQNNLPAVQTPASAYINPKAYSNDMLARATGSSSSNPSSNMINPETGAYSMNNYVVAGSSSSGISNNPSLPYFTSNDPNASLDEIKLKKKILQEKEIAAKYNLYSDPDNDPDNDNNLPPYSEM